MLLNSRSLLFCRSEEKRQRNEAEQKAMSCIPNNLTFRNDIITGSCLSGVNTERANAAVKRSFWHVVFASGTIIALFAGQKP
jgi:hypothetical protein